MIPPLLILKILLIVDSTTSLVYEFNVVYGSTSTTSLDTSSLGLSTKIHSLLKKPKGDSSSSSQSSLNTNELQVYLITSFEFGDSHDFEILEWWKQHESRFLVLTEMAKQVLSILVFIVAIKQEFSSSVNTITDYRKC